MKTFLSASVVLFATVLTAAEPISPPQKDKPLEVTLRPTRGPLRDHFFSYVNDDAKKFRPWLWLEYTMRGGIRADPKTMSLKIRELEFLWEKLDRGPEWQAALRSHKVPILGYTMYFNSVVEGDILPLLNGMLFQVVTLNDQEQAATLRRIPSDSFPGAPMVSSNTRLVLFENRGTYLGANYSPLKIKDLHRKTKVYDDRLQAKVECDIVEVQLFLHHGGIATKRREEMAIVLEVTIGSKIQVGGVEYTVRNIVLPDPEKQVIGWMELEMPPFDEEKEAAAWEKEQEMWKERWGPIRRP